MRRPASREVQQKKRKAQRKRRLRAFVLAVIVLALAAFLMIRLFRDDYRLEKEDDPVATVVLAGGEKVYVELFPDAAPLTVANFIRLANAGYYDGLPFHRVVSYERVQTGDGAETPAIPGEFPLNGIENPLSHTRGTLSMARLTGYDSAASQFFICLGDQSYLDGAYAAFGRVVKGMKHIDKIAAVPVDGNNRPLSDQLIRSIRVDAKDFHYTADQP